MVIFSNFIPQERYEKRLGSIKRFKDNPMNFLVYMITLRNGVIYTQLY